MPPKKQQGPSKKAVNALKDKKIEDKTFGLKNKNKSKAVQKYIQNVETTVRTGGQRKRPAVEPSKQELKEEKKAYEAELNSLFKVATKAQKTTPGVDPKTQLCVFFKAGRCAKGTKCKFSHDMLIERRREECSLYTDRRDGEGDGMDDWDQQKLELVVAQKGKNRPTTDIICVHFLDAIERKLYGWFWECPNGESCIYRHALPPGYVLSSNKKSEEPTETMPIEEQIEIERAKLVGGTPVNPETFAVWKRRRAEAKLADEAAKTEQAHQAFVQKRSNFRLLSGKLLFTFDPTLFADDESGEAFDARDYNNAENTPAGEGEESCTTAVREDGQPIVHTTAPEEPETTTPVAVGGDNGGELYVDSTLFADEEDEDEDAPAPDDASSPSAPQQPAASTTTTTSTSTTTTTAPPLTQTRSDHPA